MSYDQVIRWQKKHRQGTNPQIAMHTQSGFWPSGAMIKEWVEYVADCDAQGKPHLNIEEYYRTQLR